jgi:isopenicillin-N N-acyltransferase-like protein
VLESTSADAAVRRLEETGIAASAHILVADKDKAIGVESTAETIRLIQMNEHNQIFHANHLLLEHEGPGDAGWLADSPLRQQRIQDLAKTFVSSNQEPSMVDIVHLLDDHEGFPLSICRYEQGPLGMDATLFSIIMDLERRTATVCLGRPCHPEETIMLEF